MLSIIKLRPLALYSFALIQGCSLFDSKPNCNNSQVQDSVKRLYASQVNVNAPQSTLDKLQGRHNLNSQDINIKMQPTTGIELLDIKQIDINKLQQEQASVLLKTIQLKSFSKADYICEAIIEENLRNPNIAEIKKQLGTAQSSIIENNKLHIAVLYAVTQTKKSGEIEVEYAAQIPLHIILAMTIKDIDQQKSNVSIENVDKIISSSLN